MQLDEQEIQFKKRARRRLVGAIALVLLMVTILPMVLDDRSDSLPQQEIEISIPSRDSEDFTSSITPYTPSSDVTAADQKPLSDPVVTQGHSEADSSQAEESTPAIGAAVGQPSSGSVDQAAMATPSVIPADVQTFSVQIGVFSDAANVKKLQDNLTGKGIASSTEKLQTSQGEKIRLRAGPFATRELAEDALTTIKDAGLSGMIIINK